MLKGISPVLGAEALWVLAAMGHGDDLALVDRNFPAAEVAARTVTGRLVRLDGVDATAAARGFPSTGDPIRRMEVVGEPMLEVHRWPRRGRGGMLFRSPRSNARSTPPPARHSVIQTTESRPYGCFLIRKGVGRTLGVPGDPMELAGRVQVDKPLGQRAALPALSEGSKEKVPSCSLAWNRCLNCLPRGRRSSRLRSGRRERTVPTGESITSGWRSLGEPDTNDHYERGLPNQASDLPGGAGRGSAPASEGCDVPLASIDRQRVRRSVDPGDSRSRLATDGSLARYG